MATPVEKNDLLLALFLRPLRLLHHRDDGMARLRSRDRPLRPCPENTRSITLKLIVSPGFDQSLIDQLADQGSNPMITQPPGMDRRRNEGMPETVHRKQ